MVVADGKDTPLGLLTASAAPGEVKLTEKTLDTVRVPKSGRGRPKKRLQRLIDDKAADSDALPTVMLLLTESIQQTKSFEFDNRPFIR